MTQSDWEELATEPDNTTDLGYELVDWEQFETLDDTDQLIFLPQDETQLADAAFIVADNSSLVDPTDRC